jgi:hypothetical protein
MAGFSTPYIVGEAPNPLNFPLDKNLNYPILWGMVVICGEIA